ncbi:MAG: leucyl aminopeptidase [Actinobacteria bacterium]|nr:leucyl aminopeptidase [Actinomycetota bacterium]
MPSLPVVSLTSAPAKDVDVLVVGLAQTAGTEVLVGLPDESATALAKAFGRPPADVVRDLGGSAKNADTVLLPGLAGQRLIVVGLGDIDVSPEQVRRAAGAALRAASALKAERPLTLALSLDAIEPQVIKGAVEGALLGSYRYRETTGKPGVASIQVVTTHARKPEARHALDLGVATATAVSRARTWVNTPANDLYPESFADEIVKAAKAAKLSVDVWDEKALEKEGFGGLLAVGGGSSRKPRLVRVGYAPRGAKFHLALVGKGITFDTGGLNLKPADGMYTMKSDMSGAASVIAAVTAIAEAGVKLKVTAFAALAENMPSGTAYRPSDVLTLYGGTSVENGNSDAEGRLVLADALVKATEDRPDLVIDVATLTGACVVALGERVAGLMARDDETADLVLDAAEAAGELFWQLPVPEEARGKLDSKVADLRSTADRWGGALTAAAFLSEFVPESISWAHLDIAGPAFNPHEPYHYVPSGGTGMSVRTLVALAHAIAG